jgi:phenylalanyl-tRNA synthetase beta chain
LELALPRENERLTVVLGRRDDDAVAAVALWGALAQRLGLDDVVARTDYAPAAFMHPTRSAVLVDRASSEVLGRVGEIDGQFLGLVAPGVGSRRVGVLDLDVDALADPTRATRRSDLVSVPSRFPSARFDLAFVTPESVHAGDLAFALRASNDLVEDVRLFDAYHDTALATGARSLAYAVRVSAHDRTLNESEVSEVREALIAAGAALGASLR